MSVKLENVSKIYGDQKAVDAISFEIRAGEVVGFLGPNGAGKSTTMKIITSYTPPSTGKAWVDGFDVMEDSMKVRQRVGYLPESNPLYPNMYVREFLNFVAGLHHLPEKKERIEEMIEMTGLGDEARKKIGALSKGYRQRVGLAQTLIHDPDVLILDEPTTGLDPNQLLEIRKLIKILGKTKTIILSTHILQEVQAICDRVLIINKGKLVADAAIDELQSQLEGEQVVEVAFLHPFDLNSLEKVGMGAQIRMLDKRRYEIRMKGEEDIRPRLFELAVNHKNPIMELSARQPQLEEVFRSLTVENETV